MKSISFKNFRRFEDFPNFEFGDITILVGGNNAGKSTLQKALLLVFDNIKALKKKASAFSLIGTDFFAPQFRFDANQFHELKLGTFGRALYCGAKSRKMEFNLCVKSFEIHVEVEPDAAGEDVPIAKVSLIEVNDTKRHILYTFNFNTRRMRVEFEKINSNGDPKFDQIQDRIAELRKILDKENDPFEAAMANQELEKLLAVRNAFVDTNDEARESSVAETDINNYLGIKGEKRNTSLTLPGYIENFEAYTWTIGAETIDVIGDDDESDNEAEGERETMNSSEDDRANEQVLADKKSLLLESANALQSELRAPHIYYIQAHGVSQKMLYSLDDKNDSMAQAIHNYARFGVTPGTFADSFIRKWMKEFGIGSNYKIESFGGEGYTVNVETAKGWINLADMGMGTNQLMVLLFNLATIMLEEGHHGADGGKSYIPKLIIIEEPEQNLHPKLQSKLADLYSEVAEDSSYKFLIETHSEYLVRRTQVLVAQLGASDQKELDRQNPFKTYYFPEDGTPYDMKYTLSGRFENKFDTGFFDESAKWHMEILRKEKEGK
jgi:predicted ATP-dependent endonuclease of OLD family